MDKYIYKVTGDYKDWLEMKKSDTTFHNGSLIGLISYANDRLELKLNYGTDLYYHSEIKKAGDIIITVPTKEYLLKDDYMYIPLVFDEEEYEELVEISYVDRELLKNIQQVNKQDLCNILLNNFKCGFGITGYLEFNDIINSIIAFSEDEAELAERINNMISNESINLQRIGEEGSKNITIFIDFLGNLYEWNSIVEIGDKFYLKIVDDYVMEV
ncbi:hypothetical protein WAZ07_19555 [Bacillus sp. FJAT-51639]|uniref:DUF2262 domain-containing protein n=1 Tax=Bacillus bruguierae TaxID=3127667 RepID=A0ABU8FL61_9BACI